MTGRPKRRRTNKPDSDTTHENEGCLALFGDVGGYLAVTVLLELLVPYTLNRFFGVGWFAGTLIAFGSLMLILGILYFVAVD
jgi:hypothetical protein